MSTLFPLLSSTKVIILCYYLWLGLSSDCYWIQWYISFSSRVDIKIDSCSGAKGTKNSQNVVFDSDRCSFLRQKNYLFLFTLLCILYLVLTVGWVIAYLIICSLHCLLLTFRDGFLCNDWLLLLLPSLTIAALSCPSIMMIK